MSDHARRSVPRLLYLFAGLVAVCGGGAIALGWQLSRPVPARVGVPPAELNAEPVAFQSDSASLIHGWFSSASSRRGAVLLLPPVRANRLAMVPRARFLRESGYSTLLVDLQGTGESAGGAITFGWRERFDVLAAVRFLNERLPGEPVAILGASLGGAAALLSSPPLDIEALVLEAVYPSIDVAIENRLRIRMGAVGAAAAPLLLWQLKPRLGVSAADLRPIDHIGLVRCPVFVIGGAEDRHTTAAETRQLYDAARDPKRLWLIPGVAHVDFFEAAGVEYRRRILEFFAEALGSGPAVTRSEKWGQPPIRLYEPRKEMGTATDSADRRPLKTPPPV